MRLVVIGAGNGGMATAVELTLAGHDVTLYGRSADTIAPLQANGLGFEGVFGSGRLQVARITTDLAVAIAEVEAAIVALPTSAHAAVARALQRSGWGSERPVILNPGHTGGAFEFETAYLALAAAPPIVQFSTLAYVARKSASDIVNISGRAKALRTAALPGGEAALALACSLFPGAYDTGDVIACDLSNVNMVVHPPGAILGAAWVEATQGDFTFYVEGLTPGVVEIMAALDAERLAVGLAFGHQLPTVVDEMKAIGTVPSDARSDDYRAIASGEANRRIKAPDSLAHRYYAEDFLFGLVPFLAYAQIAQVPVPVASALTHLGLIATATSPNQPRRDLAAMGLTGADVTQLRQRSGS